MDKSAYHIGHDGTRLWYGTVGKGPALVLCDGLACDGFIWPYVIDHFCDHFTIVRWHYRGHGGSDNPKIASHVKVEDFCEDLNGILAALDISSAVFMGHSMGVQVILEYYRQFPEQVQ
ncbi:MAG: alpha/beta fold hydrolase, partial [Bradymonadaceae bacterium]